MRSLDRRIPTLLTLGVVFCGPLAGAGTALAQQPLTVQPRHRPASIVPAPSSLLPGAPIPWTGSPLLTPATIPIVDGETRFLTEGIAEQRCPGDPIVFVPGIVNPFRPTLPGDGAFMCHRDAVAQGIVGP